MVPYKWVVLAVLCFAKKAEPAALGCTPGAEDSSCITEEVEKEPILPDEVGVKETAPGEAECAPGSEWDSNCYRCRCSSSAHAECIRVERCEGSTEEPLRCAPNSTFARGCNTCACLASGFALCTLKECNSIDGLNPAQVRQCTPGSRWQVACNTCWCTDTGIVSCTRIGCDNEALSDVTPVEESQNETTREVIKKEEPDTSTIQDSILKVQAIELHFKPEDHNTEDPALAQHSFEELDYSLVGPEDLDDVHPLPDHNNVLDPDVATEESEKHRMLKRSICKPGQVFQNDCNTCKCSTDGQSSFCTQNECMDGEKNKEVEVFMESEGVDHIERHTVCAAHGTFYIGCNTCRCNALGTDYSCTNKPCPLPEDVELFHELKVAVLKSSTNSSKIVCVANRMFIKDCNNCWCNEDGTRFFCTRKVCVQELPDDGEGKPEDLRIIKKQCRPNEVFELDCNTCHCNPDGQSFSCTRRLCLGAVEGEINIEDVQQTSFSRKTRGVAQEPPPKACQPGQEFRLDCNKCLCDNDGQDFSCTRNDCTNGNGAAARSKRDTSENVNMQCVAGSVFDRECNVCRCTGDGNHALCTNKRCVAPQPQAENDISGELPELDPNFRCTPGEQVRRGCNDCSCSADGRSVFCTVRLCDLDVNPQTGN